MILRVACALIVLPMTILVADTGTVQASGCEKGQNKEQVIEILEPKQGQVVERIEVVHGCLKKKNFWPILLVKPLLAEEPFYVQPLVTAIGENGLFAARVHFGNGQTPRKMKFRLVAIALKLKDKKTAANFKPGMKLKSLPPDLPRSNSVIVIRGGNKQDDISPEAKPRFVQFDGHNWQVRNSNEKKVGPGGNLFTPSKENVWLDQRGHLHLAITKRDGRCQCAEVIGSELGYGEYRWVISGSLVNLDPQVVLGLFLYKDDNNEIDFELAQWGDVKKAPGQFVVQPYGQDTLPASSSYYILIPQQTNC